MSAAALRSNSPWFDRVPDQKQYPPLAGEQRADVVVVGGGIAGTMAAYHLAQAGRSVILLEKNHLATGDTGLTTGFLTHVPDALISDLQTHYGNAFVQKLFQATRSVQQELFSIIQKSAIDCDFQNCSSYWGAYDQNNPSIKKEWTALQAASIPSQFVTQPPAAAGKTWPFTEGIMFTDEGRWHIRAFIMGLHQQLQKQSVRTYEETEVMDFAVGNDVTVYTTAGRVKAKQLILTTGAPLPVCTELQALLVPYVTHVIAAKFTQGVPIARDLMWDVLEPYFYYRTISEDTVIMGGCDHPAGEQLDFSPTERLQQFMQERFGKNFELTHEWSGSIFHTPDGLPYAFAHPHYQNKVFVAMGFGGNGLIGGSWSAKTVAAFALGAPDSFHELLALQRTKVAVAKPAPRVAPGTVTQKAYVRVASTSDLKPNSKKGVIANGLKLALFRVDDTYFALANACTHAGGSLADGDLAGKTIQCPLHGAKFNVTTGAVEGPPAVRAVPTYPVRVVGGNIEVEVPAGAGAAAAAAQAAQPRRRYWKQLGLFTLFALTVWFIEFAYQYYGVLDKQRDLALVRTSAITGATFFATALFMSAIFKWWPKLAGYWRIRRYFGVAGFVTIVTHVLFVTGLLYQWQTALLYYSFNPLKNPVVFGSLALPVFFLMASTSTDWAVSKLGARHWKYIHRLVYWGYAFAIAHFLLINPPALHNIAGYIMLALTVAAVFGQFYWFLVTTGKRRFRTIGTVVGLTVILLYLILGYTTAKQLALFFAN